MEQPGNIPRLVRVSYASAEIGVSSAEVMLRVSLLIFYTQHVGISPDLASYAIALGVLWDGITDPLMGRISDHTNFKGERRRPFLWLGGFGLALFLVATFNVPELETQTQKFCYLLFTYLGTNTFMTVLAIPHTAFAADMTKDEKVRTELFGWRLIFANMGLILGTVIPAVVVTMGLSGGKNPDSYSSYWVAVLILFSVAVTRFATKGYDNAPKLVESEKISYLQELKNVLGDNAFKWLLLSYMVATIGLTLNSSLALYYYKYFLLLEEGVVRGIIAFFMLVFCLAIPMWVLISRKINAYKLIVFNVAGLGVMTVLLYPLLPPGNPYMPLIGGVIGGVFVGSVVLMDVSVANIADKKINKQGIYFGFWRMGAKLSRAIALVLTGHALTMIGFDIAVEPGEATREQLSCLFGPGVGVFLLLAAWMIYFRFLRKGEG